MHALHDALFGKTLNRGAVKFRRHLGQPKTPPRSGWGSAELPECIYIRDDMLARWTPHGESDPQPVSFVENLS